MISDQDRPETTGAASAVGQNNEGSQQLPRDRTYVARLDFLTMMHLLRWEVSGGVVITTTTGEERVRVGTVSVAVLEQLTELLRRHFTTAATAGAAGAEVERPK